MPVHQRTEPLLQEGAGLAGIVDQPLALDHVQHGQPAAQDTLLPPKVEKKAAPRTKASMIAGVVMTTPSGCPLPAGLPMVTMSGVTP